MYSMKLLVGVLSVSVMTANLVSCSHDTVKAAKSDRQPSSVVLLPPYDIGHLPAEQGESWKPSVDIAKTDKIAEQLSSFITKRDDKKPMTNRTFHPKTHGCVKADFAIDPSALPEAYRAGVFAQSANYESWIRFSNGNQNGVAGDDIKRDVRGMAVKLLNVDDTPTGSQDFVMCTAKEFFAKGAADYVALNKLAVGGVGNFVEYTGELLTSATLVEDEIKAVQSLVKIASPLESDYYSATPYKIGEGNSMKFFVEPCPGQEVHALPDSSKADPNFLSRVLQSSISTQSRCFNFYVQPNLDPKRQPIEDPRKTWNLKTSPAYKVATITIRPDSDIRHVDDSINRVNFCENLSFDPWHTRPETRPLGEIGRVRGLLYQRMSTLRHTQNGTTARSGGALPEPRSLDNPCVNEAAVLCEAPHHGMH